MSTGLARSVKSVANIILSGLRKAGSARPIISSASLRRPAKSAPSFITAILLTGFAALFTAAALLTASTVLIAMVCFAPPARADVIDLARAIEPPFLDPVESRTIFRNPADLTYYDNVFGGSLTYSTFDKKFTGSVILRSPDFGLGNLSAGVDYFGSNFGQNIVYTPTADGSGQYTLTRGGYRQAFTWAKNAGWFRIGAALKNYQYRELDTGRDESAVGLNAGAYFTALGDVVLGVTTTDINGTSVKDAGGATLRTIPNRTWLTGAIFGSDNLVLSAGIATDLLDRRLGTSAILKSISARARKLFANQVMVEAGYNSKDLYGKFGYRINDFLSMDYTISNDLSVKDGVYHHLFSFSYAIPDNQIPKLELALLLAPNVVMAPLAPKRIGRPYNPWFDSPLWWFGVTEPLTDFHYTCRTQTPGALKGLITPMLSPEGSVELDAASGPKSGTLVIHDRIRNARRIRQSLRLLDAAEPPDKNGQEPGAPPSPPNDSPEDWDIEWKS